MKKLFLAVALSFWAIMAQAGDLSEFRSLGFSEDGRFYAFAQIGIHDGSGFPFAEAAVVDVMKNEFAATQGVELSEEKEGAAPATPEQALKKAIEGIKLDRFKVKANEIMGKDLLAHLLTDHSTFKNNLFAFDAAVEGGASPSQPRYEALIETSKGEIAPGNETLKEFGIPQLLKLSIVGREGTDGKAVVLQEDKKLPKSRLHPLSYTVRRVTAYKEGIVVVVSYTTPGFEGPNVRHLVVTGKFVPAQG